MSQGSQAFGLFLLCLCCAPTTGWAQTRTELPGITIIGKSPLPGLGQSLLETASPAQSANSRDLDNSQAADLSDFMAQNMGGVYVNQVQGNPNQMDINYRGFTASPLLGTPQGLSVYMDGVRMNQAFGDVLSWDLIPRSAIASLTLVPGSNPLYGLNTLGGALAIQTKSGLSHAGTRLHSTLASGQRRALELEHGGRNDKGLNWFVTGQFSDEEGWREASPSELRQWFGKLGWKDARSQLALSLSHGRSALTGNGLQEERLLALDRRSAYTRPDTTRNQSTLINLTGQHELSDTRLLAGNAYYRTLRSSTFNGDVNDEALGQSVYQLSEDDRNALAGAGYSGYPGGTGLNSSNTPFPYWRCLAQVLQQDEPGEKCTGLINRSQTQQHSHGAALQLSMLDPLWGQRNQLTVGLSLDAHRSDFSQTSQLGYINPDRSITGLPAYADGQTGGTADGLPLDNRVHLKGRSTTWSALATNTVSIQERWHLTVSGRFNRTEVSNRDQIKPGGGSGSLDGDHVFQGFNPALGLAFAVQPGLGAYLGYSQSSRTPTAIELGCADSANPCKLPNAMAGDPPLKQVITQTWELGLRGTAATHTQWSAGVFRTPSRDDIAFVASDTASGFGYFKNFGRTLRQGLELGLQSRQGPLRIDAHYTWLDARYQSAETLGGSANSSSDASSPGLEGAIAVRPGDKLPMTPQQIFKLQLQYRWSEAWHTGLGLVAMGGMYARGNENNQHSPDGLSYLGSGRIPGYALLHVHARYQPTPQSTWSLHIGNLLNRSYATAAQLGPTVFNAQGNQVQTQPYPAVAGQRPLQYSQFVAPGAPRHISLSWRYRFN